jgi:hypothetical protein
MTFMGYATDRKAWRFWSDTTQKLVESRDAIFFEDAIIHRNMDHTNKDPLVVYEYPECLALPRDNPSSSQPPQATIAVLSFLQQYPAVPSV